MNLPKRPEWAAEIPDTAWERICAHYDDHAGQIFWQLTHYAEHPQQTFDATFYDREPILEVTLDKCWARDVMATLMYDRGAPRLGELLDSVAFSDGTTALFNSVWTLNFMPPNLDITDIDLAQGEEVAGFGGETIRYMVGKTYRCKSRAEEDFFLARWIAS
jgi:hypothetical protein